MRYGFLQSLLSFIKLSKILAAYVDVTLPTELRQKTLQATYNFTCQCTVCSGSEINMRSACFCPKCSEGYVEIKTRGELTLVDTSESVYKSLGKASLCNKCGATLIVSEAVIEKLRVAGDGLAKAERLQWTG